MTRTTASLTIVTGSRNLCGGMISCYPAFSRRNWACTTTVRQSGHGGTVVAGLSDYRNSDPSPRKPDSPQQPINCTNTCRGVSHTVPLLRFCALGSGVDLWLQQRVGKIKFWYFHPSPGPIPPNIPHFLSSPIPASRATTCANHVP